MVLAVLPMVELVEVAEGVHDCLEDRFPKIGVNIYTKSIPVRVSSKRLSRHPPYHQPTDEHKDS